MLTARQLKELRLSTDGPNRVRKAMELTKVTQVQVADAIGSRQPEVSKIARGDYGRLPLETARTLARFFGCSIEDLFPAREAIAS